MVLIVSLPSANSLVDSHTSTCPVYHLHRKKVGKGFYMQSRYPLHIRDRENSFKCGRTQGIVYIRVFPEDLLEDELHPAKR